VVCRVQQREVAVVQLQAPGAELPPPLQTLLRPVLRRPAVEREAVPPRTVLVRRGDRPVAEVAAVGRETSGLRTSHTLPAGSGELLLP
jgi:hypothetical protein